MLVRRMNGIISIQEAIYYFLHIGMINMFSEVKKQEWEQRDRYETMGAKFKNKPAEQWPKMRILWNTNPDEFYRSLDGCSQSDLKNQYPDGLLVGEIPTSDIYKKLVSTSKVYDHIDFWRKCRNRRACGLIGRWMDGNSVTPPLIVPFKNEIFIEGGNHRFNIARLYGEKNITFISPSNEKKDIERIIPSVKWMP